MVIRIMPNEGKETSSPDKTPYTHLISPCSTLLSTTINSGNNARGNQRRTLKDEKWKVNWLETPG